VELRRSRRSIAPIRPKPASIIAQAAGSGTPLIGGGGVGSPPARVKWMSSTPMMSLPMASTTEEMDLPGSVKPTKSTPKWPGISGA
jgi:hypothetical protein